MLTSTLHPGTKDCLDTFIGSWQATTDSVFDKERFYRFVNELLSSKDSWYNAVDYVKSKNMNGDYLWDWIGTLDKHTANRLRIHIDRNLNAQGAK